MDTLSTEPYMVTSKLRERGDVRENGTDKFVWEFENCENRMEQVSIQTTEVTQEIDRYQQIRANRIPRFSRRRFLLVLRPCTSLVKNVETFSQR